MDPRFTSSPRTGRQATPLLGLLMSLGLAACSTSAPPAPTGTTPLAGSPTVQPSTGATASTNVTPLPTTAGTASPAATATPVSDLPDPCVLVTKDEAETAVGTSLEGSSDLFSRPDGTTGRSCYYDAPTGPGSLGLNIWKTTPAQFALYKQEQMQFGDIHDIPGIGDEAYRSGWIQLVVLKDDLALEYGIEMVDYDPDTAQENLRTLATTSIGRL